MSGKLVGQVYDLDLPHNEQSIMLALADHGHDDGSHIRPSVGYLAWKTGYTERQVQTILRRLESKGLIEPVAYATGGRGKATEYQMHIERGAKKAPYVPPKGEGIASPYSDAKGEAISSPYEKGEVLKRVKSDAQKGEVSRGKGEVSAQKGEVIASPQPKNLREPEENPKSLGATSAPTTLPPSKPSVTFEELTPATTEERARPTQQQSEVAAWGAVMGLDITIPANAKRVGNMLTGLRKSKRCPPSVEAAQRRFGRTPPDNPGDWWYYSHTWQGQKGQPPTEREITHYWCAWEQPAAPKPRGSPPGGAAHAPPQEDGIAALRAKYGAADTPQETDLPPGVIDGRAKRVYAA